MIKGEVVYLYAFDVANEIETESIQEILANKPVPFEIKTDHTLPKDIPLYKPLSIAPTPLETTLNGKTVRLLINVYEIGVVSIAMRVPFSVKELKDLMPFHKPVLKNGKTLDDMSRELCSEICKSLKAAIIKATKQLPEPEAYTVFCLKSVGDTKDLTKWMSRNRKEIAELLTENKPNTLSDMQISEVLRIHHSYATTDLTIIDWDAALMIDSTGYMEDSLYVLELANLQLEEYKVMDQRLDRYINKAFEDVNKRSRFKIFGAHSYMLRTLRELRLEITKLNDEVTHITKLFGDWYLARIYMGARERFHLNQWRNSVEERLKQLDALYTVVQTEIANLRMLWLEILIVVFFAIDLFAIFFLQK